MAKKSARRPAIPSKQPALVTLPELTLEQALDRVERFPHEPYGWRELIRLYVAGNDLSQARAAVQKLAEIAPEDHTTWVAMGQIEMQADNTVKAHEYYERALKLKPGDFDTSRRMADVMLRLDRGDLALEHVDRALAQRPDDLTSLSIKGHALIKSGRLDEGANLIKNRLLALDPTNAGDWNNLGTIKRNMGALRESEEIYLKAADLAVAAKEESVHVLALSNRLTLMHYMPDRSAEEILQACKEWGALFPIDPSLARPRPADLNPRRKIRVGMYSEGFHQHPVGAMITPALEHLRQFGYELYLYSSSHTVDPITQRLMAAADYYSVIINITDEQFAQRIRDDGIDIMMDLAGHNSGTRMRAMTLEPAPLLVKWVGGLINTTGVPAIDYLITDRVESPLGSDAFYTEKLIRMPDDYICYLPPIRVPDLGPLPAKKNGYITLGCFNNPTKINDVILEKWAGLMRAIPDSRLFLKSAAYDAAELRQHVLDVMQGHGIANERLRLEGKAQHYDLLACYNDVDVALDPWPYSGGLTTCEALLMGVPVVTLPGPTFAGRHSATHLAHVGLPSLVAQDWNHYQACVLALASNLDELEAMRARLRKILLESPVCNGPRYAGHLAAALRAIWQRYCEGKPRASMVFTPEGKPWFEDGDAPMDVVGPDLPPSTSDDFQFQLQGKIIALDHGGTFVGTPASRKLSGLGSLITIAIDPASNLQGQETFQWDQLVQHYHPHIALGDGESATLHTCLDSLLSGTLEPLPSAKQLPALRENATVLATLPIPTNRLDDITGLEKVDWLLLNSTNDNKKILRGAEKLLSGILIVHAQTLFVDIFKKQADLTSLTRLLAKHDFQLLALTQPRNVSHFPVGFELARPPVNSQLLGADAVFVPNETRIKAMDDGQRLKLAFLLHSVYNAPDMAYQVLRRTDEALATRYLTASGWLAKPAEKPKTALFTQMSDFQPAEIAAPPRPAGEAGQLISVIITTYNIEKYIAHCLESVVNQTYKNLEIIVVDDASTDSTASIVAQYAARDSRIVVIRFEKNTPGGVATPANAGMKIAKGDYIGFVDGDDWCEPDMFERLYKAAVETNSQVAICDFQTYDDEKGLSKAAYDKPQWRSTAIRLGERLAEPATRMALLDLSPVPWRKLYRKDLIADPDMKFPEGDYFFEDNPFHWFCTLKAQSFVFVDQVFCHHRTNRTGQTTSSHAMRWLAMFRHHETILEFLKRNRLYDAYGDKLMLWIMSYGNSFFDWLEAPYHGVLVAEIRKVFSLHDPARARALVDAGLFGPKIAAVAQQILAA